MTRAPAVESKIVRRLHYAGSEMIMPNAVHDHPREQRIVRVREPMRQLPAPLIVGRVRVDAKVAAQHPQRSDRTGPDYLALVHRVAALEQPHRAGISPGGYGVNLHLRAVAQLPLTRAQAGQLILERLAPGLLRLAKRGSQLRLADERRLHPGRGGDFVRAKRPVVKLGAVDFSVEKIVSATPMPHPKNDL